MENTQHGNPQPGCLEWLTALWQALDKKQVAKSGGVVVTLGALAVLGLRKGVPWYFSPKQ